MELITFGETMVLFNPAENGPLRYVNNFTKTIAGAESNVAIALSRLGHEVGWFSKLGNDEFGRYLKFMIRGEGVDVSRVRIDKEKPTGVMFKERFMGENPSVYYYRKNSAASNLLPEDIDEDYIKSAKILHITGITPALSLTARETVYRAIEIAKNNGVKVSFDPNIRLKLWKIEEAKKVLLDIAKKVDIILPGDTEGELLLGKTNPEEIAEEFMAMGSSIVAVKLGKEGCFVRSKDEALYVKGFEVKKVVDTVGAGDGFAAGFLSGILRELSLKESARIGNAIGAMATMVLGDTEGYPTYEQLMGFLGISSIIDR